LDLAEVGIDRSPLITMSENKTPLRREA